MPQGGKSFRKESITVTFMVDALRRLVGVQVDEVSAGKPDERLVTESNLHRPGLALAGYIQLFTSQRVQILGNTESQYLEHLSVERRREAFHNLIQFHVPCIFLTSDNELAPELVEMARNREVPVYRTPVPSTDFMALLR